MNKKLLIVDDDDLTLQLYDLLLTDMEGVSFQTRNGGKDGLDFLEHCSLEEWPDYIFVDINMPDMSGYDFVAEIQGRNFQGKAPCHIYVLTSSVSHRDIEKGRQYPLIKDFIAKPLTEDKLNGLMESTV